MGGAWPVIIQDAARAVIGIFGAFLITKFWLGLALVPFALLKKEK